MASPTSGTLKHFLNVHTKVFVTAPFVVSVLGVPKRWGPRDVDGLSRYHCMVSDGNIGLLAALPVVLSPLVEDRTITHLTGLRVFVCSVDRVSIANKRPVIFIDIHDAQVFNAQTEIASEVATVATVKPTKKPRLPTARQTGTPYVLRLISTLMSRMKNFTIRARVTYKSSIVCQSFAVNLSDSGNSSGEICAFIDAQMVGKFFALFEVGKMYEISGAQTRTHMKRLELVFDKDTTVKEYVDLVDVSQEEFSFTWIALLLDCQVEHVVDILGALKQVWNSTQITTIADQRKTTKRDLLLVDMSDYEVRITLWGDTAKNFNASVGSILAFKGAKVKGYGGRTLSASESRLMVVNPDIPAAHSLRVWYDSVSCDVEFHSFGNTVSDGDSTGESGPELLTVAEANSLVADVNGTIEYFRINADIVDIDIEHLTRPFGPVKDCACMSTDCPQYAKYHCKDCRQSTRKSKHCYDFCVIVGNDIDTIRLWCSDMIGESLLGATANDMVKLQQTDKVAFGLKIAAAKNKSYIFKCKTTSTASKLGTSRTTMVINACPVV
ncbi:Replication factor A protein 1 [Coemansia furcata]|nr:Replication factor A protein 1 [Coemansia furcata]